MRWTILHTNDNHSHFDALVKVASVIQREKTETTLVLDAGDFADFRAIEYRGTRGKAATELLAQMGYDALTIGNNEMFNGIDVLEEMIQSSPVPMISNNLSKFNGSAINGLHNSIIVNKQNVRFLITGSSPDLDVFNEGLGVRMEEYQRSLKNVLQKEKGNYDICIVLNHIGTENDKELIQLFPEIDFLLSAHDHVLFPKAVDIDGVIHGSAGKYGEYVGKIVIEWDGKNVQLIDSETIPTKNEEPCPKLKTILANQKQEAITNLSTVLYDLEVPLWHDVLEENPLTNLLADGLKDLMDAEIGLVNSGICQAGLFHHVTEKKLIEICPSPLNPTRITITGLTLRDALQESLDVQLLLADGRGPGFRGKFVGKLHVAGVEVEHDDNTIFRISVNGEDLNLEREYVVATTDYLERGSGYTTLKKNHSPIYRAEEIRDVIRVYANNPLFLEKASKLRWKKTVNELSNHL
ncbi:bifunctional metallophosphatase/5'-nucleotidase [Paenisporosarcina cavernae]|uniref:Bifunctional metallophosphatase/5'-nucleotidase n=1 Tax=Paenisporosarcina cavernae TaxID=2320858 RepID=A0A385YSL4_9BACL|nr:5'-nucleotidase C-terminal domain-containing protein [Paenisporosarcina cavernae]AYC29501.1 bifunctional metallophosphatase/5'-nucleotidase [Paenisporosarcina cavernae]